jgi:hypothetical protein
MAEKNTWIVVSLLSHLAQHIVMQPAFILNSRILSCSIPYLSKCTNPGILTVGGYRHNMCRLTAARCSCVVTPLRPSESICTQPHTWRILERTYAMENRYEILSLE